MIKKIEYYDNDDSKGYYNWIIIIFYIYIYKIMITIIYNNWGAKSSWQTHDMYLISKKRGYELVKLSVEF